MRIRPIILASLLSWVLAGTLAFAGGPISRGPGEDAVAAARAHHQDPSAPLEALEITLPDGSPSGHVRALAWQADATRAPTAVHIVSPGALVPAASMATFARTLARRRGSLVLVVDYDWPVFRENAAEQAKAFTLARAFLPRSEVEIFGHSAGGAVLAPATDEPPEGLRRVVLHGVSRLFASPTAPRVPVRLLAGSRDGLVTDEGLATLGTLFSAPPERLPGVNHFCIIDGDAGSPETRALDGKTAFDTAQCASRVIDAWFAPDRRATELTADEFVALRCSADGRTWYTPGRGSITVAGPGGTREPVFRFVGVDVARCVKDGAGRWHLLSRELTLYLDPSTGKVIHRWKGDPSAQPVTVVHNANPAQSLALPPSFAAREAGSRVEVPLAMVSTRPNPLAQPAFAPYLAGESFETVETYTFSAARRDLEAFREGRVPHIARARLEFSRVGPWIPFMRWGRRGGNLEYRLVGEKTDDPRNLPRELREELRDRVPLYLEAPRCRLARRAENSWVQFATHLDAYLAGERFPLPAPATAEACDPTWDAPRVSAPLITNHQQHGATP